METHRTHRRRHPPPATRPTRVSVRHRRPTPSTATTAAQRETHTADGSRRMRRPATATGQARVDPTRRRHQAAVTATRVATAVVMVVVARGMRPQRQQRTRPATATRWRRAARRSDATGRRHARATATRRRSGHWRPQPLTSWLATPRTRTQRRDVRASDGDGHMHRRGVTGSAPVAEHAALGERQCCASKCMACVCPAVYARCQAATRSSHISMAK